MAIEPPMVKICGVTSAADAATAASLGAWAIGLVFAEESPRHLDLDQAAEVAGGVSPFTSKVGVFVRPTGDEVRAAVERCGLTLVQVHGAADIGELKEAAGLPVVEVFKVGSVEHLEAARDSPADLVLLDASVPGLEGGTGVAFDWDLLEQNPIGRSFVLAGGLTPDNVADTIVRLKPTVLDVSSGVEAAPGVKDPTLIQSFMRGVALGAERAT
ncbi:MAG: phosphoribosylanthranilate isomerase [Thermoleophilia bacterium]|nr:phosphoribosylanthranilate isomerase [Thermoleophilia bacterium]